MALSARSAPDAHAVAALLLAAKRAVVLTGLRLGQADERDETGAASAWAQRASLDALLTDPAPFWDFCYPECQAIAARRPGPAHAALARLERAGLVAALVTQAVDCLHRRAGSANVVEMYGRVALARCERCGERYGLDEVGGLRAGAPDRVPRCSAPACGYPLRPDATLWGEPLSPEAIARAWEIVSGADCLLVLDTELRTEPVSLLPSVALRRGVPLAVVGQMPTHYDRYARLVVRAPSTAVLPALADLVAPGAP